MLSGSEGTALDPLASANRGTARSRLSAGTGTLMLSGSEWVQGTPCRW